MAMLIPSICTHTIPLVSFVLVFVSFLCTLCTLCTAYISTCTFQFVLLLTKQFFFFLYENCTDTNVSAGTYWYAMCNSAVKIFNVNVSRSLVCFFSSYMHHTGSYMFCTSFFSLFILF